MRGTWVVAALVTFGLIGAAPAGAAVEPYGTNDAGGFRNVLPPGSKGVDNALDFAGYTALGTLPRHWADQQHLYDGLIQASPRIKAADIPSFFKDATFGVGPGGTESTFSPRPDVTITRDRDYGVPHVYGTTRDGVMFGAGYAGAQDRLFLMDVLRNTGRAALSSFVGGSASNRAMDRTQWALAPYTESDLQSQIDAAPRIDPVRGPRLVTDVRAYIAGINAYIDQSRLDPTKLPFEYVALGKVPQRWKETDVIATASLIGGIFGKGGGSEVRSAQVLQAFTKRFGTKKGRKAWADFRSKNDPEAGTTLKKKFPYELASPFSKRGLALPDRGSVRDAPVGASLASAPRSRGRFDDLGAKLRKALQNSHASNWELVSARESATGHPVAVMGPQVGYYIPQVLMEIDLHGPGIDARGAAFPGVNLYVQLGHGRDYAWSATTANTDNVDTFAEVLCQDDHHYMWRGQCRAMERLDRHNAWSPNLNDTTPAGSETLTAYRTVHGIVFARGTVKGRKVAFTSARTTYFHEADSALGFAKWNDPGEIRGPQDFQRAAGDINFGFNWAYIDSDHIAYYHSGLYPQRAKGTSPDFPVLGTGEYDWQNWDPGTHTVRDIGFAKHPNAIDPPYLVSWNNKQAPRWAAADDMYSYGSVQRFQMIERYVKAAIKGRKKIRIEQLVQAMEEPASEDMRATFVLPTVFKVLGKPKDPRLRDAISLLRDWARRGGHRRDLNKDGHYDDDRAVTLMDAWWPKLVAAEFKGVLGDNVFTTLSGKIGLGDHTGGQPNAPDFFDGWWSYASKDLRGLLKPKPRSKKRKDPIKGRYSRRYCGRGLLKRCRSALRQSLLDALPVTKQSLYGRGPCRTKPEASCFDMNRSTVTSAISIPDFPFQNRPTFQQVVQVQRRLPR
jgi:acyl-homoserine lactone acylase PvdQ